MSRVEQLVLIPLARCPGCGCADARWSVQAQRCASCGHDDLALAATPPPTGPAAPVPTAAQNRYAAYRAWRATAEGETAWRWILDRTLELLAKGRERVSVNALVEASRAALGAAVNNTWRAWLADDLVAADARLLELIERRRRRKAKT